MEVALFVNAAINEDIRGENHRGEWRWERQVLEALLASDKVSRVYSLLPVWQSKSPMPAKFVDGLPPEKCKDVVGIFHDAWDLASNFHFKGLIIQVFGGPGPNEIPLMERLREEYKQRFFFTYGCAHRLDTKHSSLETTAGIGHVENLAIPAVPRVYPGNNFDKNIILFPNRDILGPLRARFDFQGLFPWVAAKLAEDNDKEFHILTGFAQADIDFMHCADITQEFFSYPDTQCLLPSRQRVKLHMGMGWDGVLNMFSETKVVVGTLGDAGGTPREAAAYGIPTIGGAREHRPLMSFCPEYLSAPSLSQDYLDLVDRLYYDKDFYTRVGNSYRDFVNQFYTYDAFVNQLFGILQRRDMLC